MWNNKISENFAKSKSFRNFAFPKSAQKLKVFGISKK